MHAYMHPSIHTHRQTRRQAYKHTYLCGCLQVKLHDGAMTIVPSEDLEAVVAQKVCVAVLALCYGAARSVSSSSASAQLSPLRLLVCPDTLPSCSYTACVRHRTRLSSSCPASSKAAQAFTLSSVLSLHLMHHPTNHITADHAHEQHAHIALHIASPRFYRIGATSVVILICLCMSEHVY